VTIRLFPHPARPPVEHVQRHVSRYAPVDELGSCCAIDMDLPCHRREGGEIVHVLARRPRKPVAAMYVTRGAGAK